MPQDFQQAMNALGITSAYIIIPIFISYVTVQIVGRKLTEQFFESRMATFRHLQAVEMEKLKAELLNKGDRYSKFSKLEYEAIPLAWAKTMDFYEKTKKAITLWDGPNGLDKLNDDELEEFMDSYGFTETEKVKLRNSHLSPAKYHQRDVTIIGIFRRRYFADAKKSGDECKNYVRENSILFPTMVADKFEEIIKLTRDSLRGHEYVANFPEMVERQRARGQNIAAAPNFPRIAELLPELEMMLRDRLSKLDSPTD